MTVKIKTVLLHTFKLIVKEKKIFPALAYLYLRADTETFNLECVLVDEDIRKSMCNLTDLKEM